MTQIRYRPRGAAGTPLTGSGLEVWFAPVQRTSDGEGMVVGKPRRVVIDPGATTVFDVPVGPAGAGVLVVEKFAGGRTFVKLVPSSATPVDLDELPDVDPATPAASTAAWWGALGALGTPTPAPVTVVASVANFPGIDPSGASVCSTAFQSAIDSLHDGDTLEVPAGRYRVSGLVSVGRTWHLRLLPGAEFVQASDATVLAVRGSWETPVPVSAVSSDTASIGGETWTLGTVSTPTTMPWVSGDVVKVYSDDVLWDGRPGDVANPRQPYEGEFAVVWDVVGTTVRLKGPLRATYATNVRVARMSKTTFTVVNWKSGAEPADLGTWTASQLFLKNLYRPQVNGFRVNGGGGPACSFSSCLEWAIGPGFTVENLMNSAAAGQFGYAITDSAGEGGRAVAPQVRSVRHAFTDGSPNITAPSADPGDYGRSRNCKVIGGHADGCTSAAWDTHHGGVGHEFVDCTAIRSAIGGQLRGRGHRFINPKFVDCVTGFRAFTERVPHVRSFDHELVNPLVIATGEGLQTRLHERDDVDGPTVTVTGGRVRSRLSPMHAINGHVVLRGGVDLGFREATTGSLNGIRAQNSTVTVDGVSIDLNALGSSGSGVRAVRLADAASELTGRGLRISATGTGVRLDAAIAGVSWAEAGRVAVDDVTVDGPVVDIMRAVTADSRVGYRQPAGPPQVALVDGQTVPVGTPARRATGYLGSFGTNPMTAALADTTTTTVDAAGDAVLVPIVPDEDVTVSTLTWVVGSATCGNHDIGIYSAHGRRLTSTGPTAWPAASSTVDSPVAPVTLRAGQQYWLAFAADNATGTFRGVVTAGRAQLQRVDGTPWSRRVATSFPLPATITPGSTVAARLPMITCRSS